MTNHRNITLSLPETLLRRFRIYAAERNESMTRLMAEAIEGLMDRDKHRARAKKRFFDRIEAASDLGTKGKVWWSREELHER